jgi:hypothetical protein
MGFMHPERVRLVEHLALIPDIALVVLDFVFVQQHAELVLKRQARVP